MLGRSSPDNVTHTAWPSPGFLAAHVLVSIAASCGRSFISRGRLALEILQEEIGACSEGARKAKPARKISCMYAV